MKKIRGSRSPRDEGRHDLVVKKVRTAERAQARAIE